MHSLCAALVLTLAIALTQCHPDEVIDLPGLPSKPGFRHYSGYLNATNGRYLHYWFVESLRDPATDPLLLWLNGGPGCSSLLGLLTEQGPFRVKSDGKNLYINQYAWNNISNMLFLESPAGVGFSYSQDHNYVTDDDQVSSDNYAALESFFKKFPQFSKHDFYITGESYGGIYVPTLSVKVLNGSLPINFKGFAVGNGLSDYRLDFNSLMFFIYYHGLLGTPAWNDLTKLCCNGSITQDTCNFYDPPNLSCEDKAELIYSDLPVTGFNLYNLYDPCYQSSDTLTRLRYDTMHLFNFYNFNKRKFDLEKYSAAKFDPPCIEGADVTTYLNQKEVRAALHIPSDVPDWTVCSEDVHSYYQTTYTTMKDQYNYLLPKVRGLIYNGDTDMACNFLGNLWFVEGLGRKVLSEYTHWKMGSQVAGFVKRFENLDFVTIKGAGHMVPTDKPKEALKMISSFLFQKPY